jgi:type II secretion system protein I
VNTTLARTVRCHVSGTALAAGPTSVRSRRRGLSLLEVMLALAILGVSLAAIGELMRIGSRNAEMARDLTTAQILCETKMAEIVSGLLPATATTPAPILDVESGNDWLYAVETEQVGQEGLLAVRVIVQQNPDLVSRPVSFYLVRWMIDPQAQVAGSATSSL